MGAIAQVLEERRHQSEVGVKPPWLLIIQNIILKVDEKIEGLES